MMADRASGLGVVTEGGRRRAIAAPAYVEVGREVEDGQVDVMQCS